MKTGFRTDWMQMIIRLLLGIIALPLICSGFVVFSVAAFCSDLIDSQGARFKGWTLL